MVRSYEALYIVNPDLQDENIQAIMDKYKAVVEEQGGEVTDVNRWEKRRLAYEVKGLREGIYILMNFKSESSASKELDRRFRIADDVMRHMITLAEENQ